MYTLLAKQKKQCPGGMLDLLDYLELLLTMLLDVQLANKIIVPF